MSTQQRAGGTAPRMDTDSLSARITQAVMALVLTVVSVLMLVTTHRFEFELLGVEIPAGLLFGALFTMAGALQFWLVDGREFANAFTYGGNYVATTPGAVFSLPMRAFFTFVIPATLIAYAPALALLDLPGPALVPTWAGWLGLPAAVLAWAVAGLLWRAGVRRYTGAGG